MIISEGYLIRESGEKEIQKFTFNLSHRIEFGGRLILVVPPTLVSSFAAERVVRYKNSALVRTIAVKYLNIL